MSEWISIKETRTKYDSSLLKDWIPSENEEIECEVKATSDENEPYGWCEAICNKCPSDCNTLFSISYVGWDSYNDLLLIEYLRPKSRSHQLSHHNMYRKYCINKKHSMNNNWFSKESKITKRKEDAYKKKHKC